MARNVATVGQVADGQERAQPHTGGSSRHSDLNRAARGPFARSPGRGKSRLAVGELRSEFLGAANPQLELDPGACGDHRLLPPGSGRAREAVAATTGATRPPGSSEVERPWRSSIEAAPGSSPDAVRALQRLADLILRLSPRAALVMTHTVTKRLPMSVPLAIARMVLACASGTAVGGSPRASPLR